jgi:hypothetical protein
MHVGLGRSLAMPMMLMMTPLMRGFDFFCSGSPDRWTHRLADHHSLRPARGLSPDCGKQMRRRGECRGDTQTRMLLRRMLLRYRAWKLWGADDEMVSKRQRRACIANIESGANMVEWV